MKRFLHSTRWLSLPLLMLSGTGCISRIQIQDFAVSESARVIGGMVGLVLQLALRAILPQTIVQ